MKLKRIMNQGIARVAGRWPVLAERLTSAFDPIATEGVPWTRVSRSLEKSRIALVTTAGVHHRAQQPFDMGDSQGDPSYRILSAAGIESDFVITHDYYDHRDAERDLNIVLPVARLREMAAAGVIGAAAERHYSFMGHIDGPHVRTLVDDTAPQVAGLLRDDGVDAVLLTPA